MPKFEISVTAQIPKANSDDIDQLRELHGQFRRFLEFLSTVGTVKTRRIVKHENGFIHGIM